MNPWDYRIIDSGEQADPRFAIHEVYYDKYRRPATYTEEPVALGSESLAGIYMELHHYQKAFDKPVLKKEDFNGKLADN